MTPEQLKGFSEACVKFGEMLDDIFGEQAPTLERQGTWTIKNNCSTEEPENDWEILEFRSSLKSEFPGVVFTLSRDGRYHTRDCDYALQNLLFGRGDTLENGRLYIHTVRRLSDNTVWTMGDEVLNDTGGVGKITRFYINENDGKMCIQAECFVLHRLINQLKKPEKQPLFITAADGIQVLKSQKLYSFLSNGEIITHPTWEDASDKYSSKEEAQKGYIKWFYEQPVLSLEDILSLQGRPEPVKAAKELVRHKIATR